MARGRAAGVAAEIGAILLAAGASRRMGTANKLLLPVDGVPMVARVAQAIGKADLPMLVVLGCEAKAVRDALLSTLSREGCAAQRSGERAGLHEGERPVEPSLSLPPARAVPPPGRGRVEGVTFVHAADWAEGMGSSFAAGVRAIPAHWSGAIVCLGDMPFVGADLLRRLAAALITPDTVAVPVHDGRRGNPVGWGRAWFARLAVLGGDAGGRALLAGAALTEIFADASIHRDFDTPEDLAAR